jgi:hypothetical protein
MKIHWRGGKLGAVGLSAAAIAVAAVPDEMPASKGMRSADYGRPRPAASVPAVLAVQLDMERLKRLQAQKPEAEAGREAAPAEAAAPAEPARRAEPAAVPPVAEAPVKAEIVDAFATKTWYVPPPPPPPVKLEPPPKPTAPPLPFSFMGSYDDFEGPTVIMLVRGDRLYTVSEGDSIDGTYRVERVANGLIELTYLPLQEKQLLQTGNPG